LSLFAGKLGANAILGVSLAVCKAGAAHKVIHHMTMVILHNFNKVWYKPNWYQYYVNNNIAGYAIVSTYCWFGWQLEGCLACPGKSVYIALIIMTLSL
jgi:hypothetical protein